MKTKMLTFWVTGLLSALLLLPARATAQEEKPFVMTEETENVFRPHARQLLYVTLPGTLEDAAWRNGIGIVVLDVNDNYRFIKRIPAIDIPASMSPEQVSGVTAHPATNMIYVAYRGRMAAFDLATEKLVWEQTYDGHCCERPQITPDGKVMIVGADLPYDYWYVINTKTGKLITTIKAPLSPLAHNLNLSPDGKTAFMSPNGKVMTIASMETYKVTKTIRFGDNVRPFVINHDASLIYANTNNLLGFEVADVATGKVIKRVEVPGFNWKSRLKEPMPHGCPSHGIALSFDESEVWIVDGLNDFVHVFDNTVETPVLKYSIKTGKGPAWITVGLDGKYAYVSSGDIIDMKTHQIIGQMKDEYGRVMRSEKLLDMAFRDGKLQRVSNQFGNGDAKAVAARRAATGSASAPGNR
jgi:DNA-binding beta-propeller fold protein YncE